MKTFNHLFLSLALVCFFAASCGSSNSSGCSEVEQDQKQSELSEAQTHLTDSEYDYLTDSTPEKCLVYADAWDAYLVKLRAFVDCLDGPSKSLWETNYQNQVMARNELSC